LDRESVKFLQITFHQHKLWRTTNINQKLLIIKNMVRIPISIITGYLGAGKTTLLRRIISETDKKIAILMNEFGEISIDGKIIKGKAVDMIELSGGCVCCSLTGEFEAAIKEIIEKVKPEIILLETTGVAEPDAIIFDIEENLPEVRLDSVITVVDADGVAKYPQIGHTSRVQIEMADVILINKVDLVTDEQYTEVYNLMKTINPNAIIFDTVRCDIDVNLLFGFNVKKSVKVIQHDHLAREKIESFVITSDKTYDRDLFDKFVSMLPPSIFRSKGFVKFSDGFYLFNFVNGRWEFEKFDSDKTELVFIGKNISKEKDSLIEKLRECEIKQN
jgi:G3E family GTPase